GCHWQLAASAEPSESTTTGGQAARGTHTPPGRTRRGDALRAAPACQPAWRLVDKSRCDGADCIRWQSLTSSTDLPPAAPRANNNSRGSAGLWEQRVRALARDSDSGEGARPTLRATVTKRHGALPHPQTRK